MQQKKRFNIQFIWPKYTKGKGFETNRLTSSNILINGVLFTCIVLSLASGFIDLVFFSGLSKSFFELFGYVQIASAVLYTVMSIGFTMGKFFCAMRLGMMKELYTRLKSFGFSWAENVKKQMLPWQIVHKFLIGVSIITAISLSVVSIGAGVTRNANTLKRIDDLIEEGTRYSNIVNTTNDEQLRNLVKSGKDTSNEDAINFTRQKMEILRPLIEDYKKERKDFIKEFGNDAINSREAIVWREEEILPSDYWTSRNNEVNLELQNAGYPRLNGPQIYNLNLNQVERTIKNNRVSTYKDTTSQDNSLRMEEMKKSTLEEARAWVHSLNAIGFTKNVRTDKGWEQVPIVFNTEEENTKVLVESALMQLKAFRVDVENDSGDIGSSSKIFMLVGSWIEGLKSKTPENLDDALNVKVKGGLGSTEVMMIVLILVFGIVQEFLIALFTPKSNIDRKIISQMSGLEWKDNIEKNKFLLSVYIDYEGDGIINEKDFIAKRDKCCRIMNRTVDSVIQDYNDSLKKATPSKKVVSKEDAEKYSSKVEEAIKEIDSLIQEA